MIKVIAFDLVGVLATEKDIELSEQEDKIERLFGPNKSDADFLNDARKIISDDSILMRIAEDLIGKLYDVKNNEVFRNIKKYYPDIKIIIATNHVSYVRNFIKEELDIEYLDDVLISAEIHKIKPEKDFYEYILKNYKLNSDELLFIDDNIDNVTSAKELGINTIKVDKETKLLDEILAILKTTNN